jgi:flagellin
MDVLGSAGWILQNQALTQNRLRSDVNALASGLRVRSAVDDPSGYALAANMHAKAAGLQQSVTNVQTANNLLNVAEGALGSIERILQRIRSLAVGANSDLNSSSDLQNVQTEIDQLLLEINKIASNTNFNGLTLFNGQFQGDSNQLQSSTGTVVIETPAFPNSATGATGSDVLADGTGTGLPAQFMDVLDPIGSHFVPTYAVWSIVSASSNMLDPDTNTYIGPGVLIEDAVYSVVGSSFGPTPLFVDYSAFPTNAGASMGPFTINAPSAYPLANPQNVDGIIYNGVIFNNITAADVGVQEAILTLNPTQVVSDGQALTVNDGGGEGQTVSISIPLLNTDVLNVSGISVLAPQVTQILANGANNQPVVAGVSSSNVMAVSYAEIVLDRALNTVNTYRAQIGAQSVALQQDASNDDTAIVNLTATESNIRDVNIGQTTIDFTKQQILVNVGTSVLSQIDVSAQQLTALLLNSFSGLTGLPAG